MKLLSSVLFIVTSLSFSLNTAPFELKGKVSSNQGFPIPNALVQIKENNRIIAQTRTNNFGEYNLPIIKKGTFSLVAGNQNKYFHH